MEAVYSFITGDSLGFYLLAFIAVSYLIVGLLTWSFIKPLKYLGFPIIIVGIVCFGLKGILSLVVDTIEEEKIAIIKVFINNSGNLFVKYAIICLITGLLMITLYYVLKHVLKSNKNSKKHPKTETSIEEEGSQEEEQDIQEDDFAEEDEDENLNE